MGIVFPFYNIGAKIGIKILTEIKNNLETGNFSVVQLGVVQLFSWEWGVAASRH